MFAWLLPHRSLSPEFFGRYSPEYLMFMSFVLAGVIVLTILAYITVRHPGVLRLPSLGGSLGLLAASIVFALLAAEIFTRTVDLLGISMMEEVTRYIMDLEQDPDLVYRHRANMDTVYQDVAFRTNEIGLRDRKLLPAEHDELRVLVLGDSVTLGWGVPVEETFPARLEQELAGRTGRPVRSINSGVSGYNTVQELAFLKRHADSMAPDMVVLVYVENDIEPEAENMVDMQHRWENPPGANATLLRWSWLYRIIYYILPGLISPPTVPQQQSDWDRSMEALTEIHQLTRQQGIDFAVFLYRMTPNDITDKLHSDISDIADSQGFLFIDTLPWFEGVHIRSVINSFVDSHPNSEGHRIIATGIADNLAEHRILCRFAGDNNSLDCADEGAFPVD